MKKHILISLFCLTASTYAEILNQIKPFETDGCTRAPDGFFGNNDWLHCCMVHDISYWIGGTRDEKHDVDEEFRLCIQGEKVFVNRLPFQGRIYKAAVRAATGARILGIIPNKLNFRWGRGWNSPTRYFKLTDVQISSSREELVKIEKLFSDPDFLTRWDLRENQLDFIFQRIREIDSLLYEKH